jgi:putative heme-binding domain-containing protein
MTRLLFTAAVLVLPALAQNEQDIASGKALFRSNCAFCHGITAQGGRGPSLISPRIIQNTSDEAMRAIIRNGIPGTTMPGFESFDKDDLTKLVTFIRTLGGSAPNTETVKGDVAHGKQLYASNGCAACHRVGDAGSSYGPELTRIGAARSPEYIRQSIVDPTADIPQEYEGVTAVTKDGKRVRGVRVNEDTFSVQLRQQNEKFAMFQKADLKEVVHEDKSLMPPYRLPMKDMTDLVAYLDMLRGDLTTGADAQKAKGIK